MTRRFVLKQLPRLFASVSMYKNWNRTVSYCWNLNLIIKVLHRNTWKLLKHLFVFLLITEGDFFSCFGTCRNIVKLTAQFVARNGRQFLTNLMNREQVSVPKLCSNVTVPLHCQWRTGSQELTNFLVCGKKFMQTYFWRTFVIVRF